MAPFVRAFLTDRAKRLRARGVLQISSGLLAVLGATFLLAQPSVTLVRLVLDIEDDALRRSVLGLLATTVAFSWILVQGAFRVPLLWLVDLESYLALPVTFRGLYGTRLVASLFGWWPVLIGPPLFVALRDQARGPLHLVATLLAVVLLVAVLGRVVSLVALQTRNLLRRHLGSALLLGVFILVFAAFKLALGDLWAAGQIIAESQWLSVAGVLPPGLAVRILDSPADGVANLWRLAALGAFLAGLARLEYRLLRRHCLRNLRLDSPTAMGGTAQSALPLARLLRRPGLLSRSTCLTLVEIESTLRISLLRASFVVCAAYAIVHRWTADDFLTVVAVTALPIAATSQLKANILGSSHRHLSESFNLPIHSADHPRAKLRALNLLTMAIPALALFLTLLEEGWPGTWLLTLWICLPAALVMVGDVACSWADLRWPRPIDYGRLFPTGGNQVGSTLMIVAVVVLGGAFAALFLLGASGPYGPPIATAGALAIAGTTAAARMGFLRWQTTQLAANREEILAKLAADH